MRAHQDTVQRTVIFGFAVVGALLNGAFHTLVCVTVHTGSSFLIKKGGTAYFVTGLSRRAFGNSMAFFCRLIPGKIGKMLKKTMRFIKYFYID